MPLIVAPTGFIRMIHSDGELGAARAASKAGVPIAISTVCGAPAEAVTTANDDTWFQLYMLNGREGASFSIDVARRARCRVLVVTVDVAGISSRERPGRPPPMKVDLASAIAFLPEVWNKPHWLLSLMRGGLTMTAPNALRRPDGSVMTAAETAPLIHRTPPTWDDLAWIRTQWDGPFVIKGILRAKDAMRAIDIGADAISVSNHGGKSFDGTPAALSVLPEIVDAVGTQAEILLDGGIRRGADVVRACALGAKAVLIGRAYLWGLAVAGEAGVSQVLQLFHSGIGTTLAQLGCPSMAALDRSWLRFATERFAEAKELDDQLLPPMREAKSTA